jgi:hypothetical protein
VLDFFLVLGLIPGTNFQITFNEIVFVVALLAAWYFRRQLRRQLSLQKRRTIAYLRLKYWQHKQLSLPV